MSWSTRHLTTLSQLEARGAAAAFSSAIRKIGLLDAYLTPAGREIRFRSTPAAGRRPYAPPIGAVHVGRYDRKASSRRFVEDLDALLAQLAQEKAA